MLISELEKRGHELMLFGPIAANDPATDWPLTSSHVAQAVADNTVEQGIVCCWTGTGASIAANKVPGARAALCQDAETARGARTWNHANVLALSLRSTSEPIAKEILDAWFSTPYSDDAWELPADRTYHTTRTAPSLIYLPFERDTVSDVQSS
jgi:ribose 5-phosphate isomerase B